MLSHDHDQPLSICSSVRLLARVGPTGLKCALILARVVKQGQSCFGKARRITFRLKKGSRIGAEQFFLKIDEHYTTEWRYYAKTVSSVMTYTLKAREYDYDKP